MIHGKFTNQEIDTTNNKNIKITYSWHGTYKMQETNVGRKNYHRWTSPPLLATVNF